MNALGGGNNLAQSAAQQQLAATDANQAQTIQTQMAADAQKSAMERWKIMQDLQTFMFKTLQEAALTRSKVGHQMAGQWSKLMLS